MNRLEELLAELAKDFGKISRWQLLCKNEDAATEADQIRLAEQVLAEPAVGSVAPAMSPDSFGRSTLCSTWAGRLVQAGTPCKHPLKNNVTADVGASAADALHSSSTRKSTAEEVHYEVVGLRKLPDKMLHVLDALLVRVPVLLRPPGRSPVGNLDLRADLFRRPVVVQQDRTPQLENPKTPVLPL